MGTLHKNGRRFRNKKILMDNLSGVPMALIALEYDLHPSRIGQICQATLRNHGLHRDMGKLAIGAALARTHTGRASPDTPEGFWWEVEHERQVEYFRKLPDMEWDEYQGLEV